MEDNKENDLIDDAYYVEGDVVVELEEDEHLRQDDQQRDDEQEEEEQDTKTLDKERDYVDQAVLKNMNTLFEELVRVHALNANGSMGLSQTPLVKCQFFDENDPSSHCYGWFLNKEERPGEEGIMVGVCDYCRKSVNTERPSSPKCHNCNNPCDTPHYVTLHTKLPPTIEDREEYVFCSDGCKKEFSESAACFHYEQCETCRRRIVRFDEDGRDNFPRGRKCLECVDPLPPAAKRMLEFESNLSDRELPTDTPLKSPVKRSRRRLSQSSTKPVIAKKSYGTCGYLTRPSSPSSSPYVSSDSCFF